MNKFDLTNMEVAQILEDFLKGDGGKWDWDDFTLGMSFANPLLESIRKRCANLGKEFPPSNPNEYCNEEGRDVIRDYIKQLGASN